MKFRNVSKKVIILSIILISQGLALFAYYNNALLLEKLKTTYIFTSRIPFYIDKLYASKGKFVSSPEYLSSEKIKSSSTAAYVFKNNTHAQSIPVLVYHGIIKESDGENTVFEDFRDHIFSLKKTGWQTVGIQDFYAFMNGEKKLPEKSILITFDDGRKDAYYKADSIFEIVNYTAVSFIISKYSTGKNDKGNYYLSEDDLKRMVQSGRWEIEAHTRNGHDLYAIDPLGTKGHFYSDKLWLNGKNRLETTEEFTNRIRSDFFGVKNDLESALKINIIAFAFPFGDFGQDSLNFPESKNIISGIIKIIYPLSFYQEWEGNFKTNYPQPGKKNFLIKRMEVQPAWNGRDLLDALARSEDKLLPYEDNFTKDNGWIQSWGKVIHHNGSLTIGADTSITGSFSLLDGTYTWNNYTFHSLIDWKKGSNIILLARYQDDSNFSACNFARNSLRIVQRLKGKERIMIEKKLEDDIFAEKNDLALGISVYKDKIECLADKKVLGYTYFLSPLLSNGGIGFMSWDEAVNNSEFTVKRISVEEIK